MIQRIIKCVFDSWFIVILRFLCSRGSNFSKTCTGSIAHLWPAVWHCIITCVAGCASALMGIGSCQSRFCIYWAVYTRHRNISVSLSRLFVNRPHVRKGNLHVSAKVTQTPLGHCLDFLRGPWLAVNTQCSGHKTHIDFLEETSSCSGTKLFAELVVSKMQRSGTKLLKNLVVECSTLRNTNSTLTRMRAYKSLTR